MERRKRGDERRGIQTTAGSPGAFSHWPTSPLLYPSDSSLQKPGQESSTFYINGVHFRNEEQKQFNKITDGTSLSSASPCVVIRHPFYDMRIPPRFQPTGCYYLIPSSSRTRLQIRKGNRKDHSLSYSVNPKAPIHLR